MWHISGTLRSLPEHSAVMVRQSPTRSRGRRWQSIGFVAAFTQMIGACLFQLSVVAGVPNLISPNDWQLVDALVWTPQAR